MIRPLATIAFAATALLAALPAQKIPLPGEGNRQLQLFDLLQKPQQQDRAAQTQAIATFVRTFVQPALRPEDDVQVLGNRWLAVLGDQQQIASAERLLAIAGEHREDLLTIEISLYELTAATFDQVASPLLPKPAGGGDTRQLVLAAKDADALTQRLVKAEVDRLEAPRLSVLPMQKAELRAGEQISYIKDFTITPVAGKQIADPVVDTIWNGIEIELLASFVAKDRVGVACKLAKQEVAKPIAEFTTQLGVGLQPLTVQLPHATGVRLQQTAELAPGSTIAIAAPKTDGGWLLALVTVIVQK